MGSAWAEQITAEDIQLYLSANHWVERHIVNDFLSIWEHSDVSREIFVPRTMRAVDFDNLVELIIRLLAEIEDRQPSQVFVDMKHTGADVIRVRIDTTKVDRGTISLEKAASVITEIKATLSASARASIHPQNHFTARPPNDVSDYMETTRLGQTEPGSFIFTVISPLLIKARKDINEPPPLPFARRVTKTLWESLEGIREACEFSEISLERRFEDLVEKGVSANLCESLSLIAEQSFDRAVDIGFNWSSKVEPPVRTARTNIIVPPMIATALPAMAKHLKSIEPEAGFEILGKVERLSNQEESAGFALALRVSIGKRDRLIALDLKDDARAIASTAWSTGDAVFVRGTLDKRYRPYRLMNPEKFEIVSVSSSETENANDIGQNFFNLDN